MRTLLAWTLVLAALLAQGLRVRIEPPSAQVRAGTQVCTVAHAEGGTPPYRFEWFVGQERTGEVNQAKMWVLRRPGRYTVRVVATDQAGLSGEAEAVLTVGEIGARLEGQDPLTVTVWGLTPPYTYQVYLGDRPQGPPRTSSSPHEVFPRPGSPGAVQVRVTDANGLEVWAVPGASPPAPVGPPPGVPPVQPPGQSPGAPPATPSPGPGDDFFGKAG